MFRLATSATAWEFGKWCGYAVILLVPGSLVVLPVLWLVEKAKGGSTMNDRESSNGFARWLLRWLRPQDTAEQYLAEAASLAELERRMRVLERKSGGPVFVTFNH